MIYERLRAQIQRVCWGNDELLDGDTMYPLDHPLAGHCYVASEALFYATSQYDEWEVRRVEVPVEEPLGGTARFTHWYLYHRFEEERVDLTSEQFTDYGATIPYENHTATGFMTSDPSGRARQVLDEITPSHIESFTEDPDKEVHSMTANPDLTVDGRFTSNGLSVSVYDEDGNVVDETWFTYDEIEERKGDEESDFTFEIDEEEI